MDIRTRQGLLNALVGKVGKRMDNLLVPLELLSCVSRTEFPDKKAYLRWQKRQASHAILFRTYEYPYYTYIESTLICIVKYSGGRAYKLSCSWIRRIRTQSK